MTEGIEMQRGARHVLRGEFDVDVAGADLVEARSHHGVGEFGKIALATEVAEVEVAQIGGHDFLGGVGGIAIREMAVAAGDALLEAPRAAGFLEHFEVVIGLEEEDIGGADAFERELGGVAEVGEEADFALGRVQEVADRVGGIVRDAERIHDDVANLEGSAGFEDAAVELGLELPFHFALRFAVAKNGDLELRAEGGEAVDVVGMLVGDEHAGETFGSAADGGQSLADLAQTEASIDQKTGFGSLKVRTITAGSAAENGQLDSHGPTVGNGTVGSNSIRKMLRERELECNGRGISVCPKNLQQKSDQFLAILLELLITPPKIDRAWLKAYN